MRKPSPQQKRQLTAAPRRLFVSAPAYTGESWRGSPLFISPYPQHGTPRSRLTPPRVPHSLHLQRADLHTGPVLSSSVKTPQ
jgi:hypothetical protein